MYLFLFAHCLEQKSVYYRLQETTEMLFDYYGLGNDSNV